MEITKEQWELEVFGEIREAILLDGIRNHTEDKEDRDDNSKGTQSK